MKGIIAALLVLLGACTVAAPPVEAPSSRTPYPVRLAVDRTRLADDVSGCSSVSLGHGMVVTARHCIESDEEGLMALGTEKSLGTLRYVSDEHDFALFHDFGRLDERLVELRAPELGEHLYAVGFPMQIALGGKQRLTVSDGVFAGPEDNHGSLRFTAAIYFGSSGGGVWGDDGAFIGVSVSGVPGQDGMNYLVPADAVLRAWERL